MAGRLLPRKREAQQVAVRPWPRRESRPKGRPPGYHPPTTTTAGTPIMLTQLVAECGPPLRPPSWGIVSSGGGIWMAGYT